MKTRRGEGEERGACDMNLEDYAEMPVQLHKVPFSKASIEEAAALSVRWGFPEPCAGVMLFANHRGDDNNGVDWAARKLREYVVQLIEDVVGESVAAVNNVEGLSKEDREKAVRAIRERLGLIVH
jgi:hypothetical protein